MWVMISAKGAGGTPDHRGTPVYTLPTAILWWIVRSSPRNPSVPVLSEIRHFKVRLLCSLGCEITTNPSESYRTPSLPPRAHILQNPTSKPPTSGSIHLTLTQSKLRSLVPFWPQIQTHSPPQNIHKPHSQVRTRFLKSTSNYNYLRFKTSCTQYPSRKPWSHLQVRKKLQCF